MDKNEKAFIIAAIETKNERSGLLSKMVLLYIDQVLFPVPPSKIVTETENDNRTIRLIDGSEVTLPGGRGLRRFSFDLLLPVSEYPFGIYEGEFKEATYFIDVLNRIAEENKAVWFDVYRTLPDLRKTYSTNILVVPEKITVEENAENGLDMTAQVVLREYRKLSAGVMDEDRHCDVIRQDTFENPATYTVKSGDSLWLIAKKYLGSGDKYKYLAELNGIKSPYSIQPNQVLKLR